MELVKWSNRLAVTEAEKKTEEFMQANSLGVCVFAISSICGTYAET